MTSFVSEIEKKFLIFQIVFGPFSFNLSEKITIVRKAEMLFHREAAQLCQWETWFCYFSTKLGNAQALTSVLR